MSAVCEIEVVSPVFGATGDQAPLPTVGFRFGADRISVRELIALTVEAQVNKLLDERSATAADASLRLARHYLSAEDIEQQAMDGQINASAQRQGNGPIHLPTAILRAQRAFERGLIKIAIDGQLAASLDETVPLMPRTPATFIRLMPLVGG